MPVSVKFENDGLGVLLSAHGIMKDNDFAEANRIIYVPEVMTKLRYQIVDLTNIENVDTNWDKLRRLAETDKNAADEIPGLKIALIADGGVLEAMAQIYQRLAKHESLITRIFRNQQDARRWVADCVVMEASA